MRSEVQVTGSVTTVTLHGDLDMAVVDALRDVLDEALASPAERILVALADVAFMDVVSLSVILAAADTARESARQLTVSGPSTSVRRLCALLNADDILEAPLPAPRASNA
jgi:anti-anti-sigma factor